jgi:cytochrome c-type biogenesis protein CcmF
MLLLVACAAVMLGTLYPLIIDALGLGKLSVGPPYFEAVFVPIIAPALFLMGVGPLTRWRRADLAELTRRLRWALQPDGSSPSGAVSPSQIWSVFVVWPVARRPAIAEVASVLPPSEI